MKFHPTPPSKKTASPARRWLLCRGAILLVGFLGSVPLTAQDWCHSPAPASPEVAASPWVRPKTAITIPVVVHVVWFTEAERLSEAQVRSQIAVLNEDFRALNADLTGVIPFYQNRIADLELNFALATTDPQGNPTTGIVYAEAPRAGIGSAFDSGRRRLCYDGLGGSSAWCTTCYLNIWVADLGLSGVAGIGIFPTQTGSEVPRAEDGVYIQSNRFGRTGTVTEPYHLGRTTTHEVGHYLNLLHPWGPVTPPVNCAPSVCCPDPAYDDLVADTEKQIRTYANECPAGSVASCPPAPDNYQNFMGFAQDPCAIMFTEGQKTRVWESLLQYRPGLLNPTCRAECIVGVQAAGAPASDLLSAAWVVGETLYVVPATADIHWQLFTLQGQQVHRFVTNLPGGQTITLPPLPAGVYLLVGEKEKQKTVRKLFVTW
ncbi:MAG: hypothetical protein DA408_11765 [Bacteroidetes bacterium]|nr:MAG: hypothetical protein DA408_11765 [Bacteroidota bacterium]